MSQRNRVFLILAVERLSEQRSVNIFWVNTYTQFCPIQVNSIFPTHYNDMEDQFVRLCDKIDCERASSEGGSVRRTLQS